MPPASADTPPTPAPPSLAGRTFWRAARSTLVAAVTALTIVVLRDGAVTWRELAAGGNRYWPAFTAVFCALWIWEYFFRARHRTK